MNAAISSPRLHGCIRSLGIALTFSAAVIPFLVGCAQGDRRELKVALAQPMTVVGEVQENFQRMRPLIASAARANADLVVFSEGSLTGFDLKGQAAKAAIALDDAVFDAIAQMAREHDLAIVVGFYEQDASKLYNTAMVLMPDGRRIIQRKHKIDDAEKESCPVTAGPRKRRYFDLAGFRCALLICADATVEKIYDELAAEQCEAVILITAGGGDLASGWHQADLDHPERRRKYLDAALTCIAPENVEVSLKHGYAQIACNQAGWDESAGYFQPGGGWIVDHDGKLTAVLPARFVFEHLQPDLAIGTISRPAN